MNSEPDCPRCGNPIPESAPGKLCPACLMDAGEWTRPPSDGDAGDDPTMMLGEEGATGRQLPAHGETYGGYRIVRELGRGGMGVVFEAEELESGRRVALKLLGHQLDSEDARSRFLREGRVAASVNHPNSVYIFGTEEIGGMPAIAMELVGGGTLQDRVRESGPLPTGEAIDAILEVISGLEAAEKLGILHRDVKPSNCFLDADGSTKIGDFGLSISTAPTVDTRLTAHGTLVGTPSFSSPEQLRGEVLDTTSDIYSVGATLFYLLTGRPPFEDENVVQLLSRVLQEQPTDPREIQPEIPKPLAEIILRCLAKNPAKRFRSYGELSAALEPFNSLAPSPGTLARRFLAYMIDATLVLALGAILLQFVRIIRGSWEHYSLLHLLCDLAVTVGYFGIIEGVWGSSPGKRMLGLFVSRPESGGAPGVPTAALRALTFSLIYQLPAWLLYPWTGKIDLEPDAWIWLLGVAAIGGGPLILFWPARRQNGYAGFHDLLSGTRVTAWSRRDKRSPLREPATSSSAGPSGADAGGNVGPFQVIRPLGAAAAGGEWLLCFDPKLLREVWVRRGGSDSPGDLQRALRRPGRLRWIGGHRDEDGGWDAFEAPGGQRLTALLGEPRPWGEVRHWVADVAAELRAAEADGTTPGQLSLDRVWIAADGQAKLLDFDPPGGADEGSGEPIVSLEPVALLHEIAHRSTGGSAGGGVFPAHLAPLLGGDLPRVVNLEEAHVLLQGSLGGRAEITRGRRLALALGASAFGIFLATATALCFVVGSRMEANLRNNLPEVADLIMIQMAASEEETADAVDLRRYIAHIYRDRLEDPAAVGFMGDPVGVNISLTDPTSFTSLYLEVLDSNDYVAGCVAEFPELSEEEIARVEAAAAEILEEGEEFRTGGEGRRIWVGAAVGTMFGLFLVTAVIPALLAAPLFKGGVVMRALGITVVDGEGREVGRRRLFLRALVAWSPFLMILVPWSIGSWNISLLVALLTPLPFLLSAWMPGRGLADRITRTWLVPR